MVIPVHRGGAFLREAVVSILGQTLTDFEVVLVSDGCPEDLSDLERMDPRVRVLRRQHAGVSVARNTGVTDCTTEFVAFLDEDDRAHPGRLEWQVDSLCDVPGSGMGHGEFEVIDAEGRVVVASRGVPLQYRDMLELNFPLLSTLMVRRDHFHRVGGFDPALIRGEDIEFSLRAAMTTDVVFVPKVITSYRRHDSNTTTGVWDVYPVIRRHQEWAELSQRPDLVASAELGLRRNRRNAARAAFDDARSAHHQGDFGQTVKGLGLSLARDPWFVPGIAWARLTERADRSPEGRLPDTRASRRSTWVPTPRNGTATAGHRNVRGETDESSATGGEQGRSAHVIHRVASVAVVTYERPDHVRRCLQHLLVQTVAPSEIIVVDSSESDDTARLCRAEFPTVAYEVCTAGRGSTSTARDIAYRMTTCDVLAFVDDDAFVEPGWLECLLPFYDDPTVGGVGGRQIREQPGELAEGVDAIGLLLPDGTLTGHFAADPGHPVDVDHLLGANMSFRRTAIDRIGGIRDGYAGTCIREETDICFQVREAGYRLVFTPEAVVEHVAGPYAKGQRFDLRYDYWAQKNHMILLIRNFGVTDVKVRRFLTGSFRAAVSDGGRRLERSLSRLRRGEVKSGAKAAGAAVLRLSVTLAGSLMGVVAGVRLSAGDRHR